MNTRLNRRRYAEAYMLLSICVTAHDDCNVYSAGKSQKRLLPLPQKQIHRPQIQKTKLLTICQFGFNDGNVSVIINTIIAIRPLPGISLLIPCTLVLLVLDNPCRYVPTISNPSKYTCNKNIQQASKNNRLTFRLRELLPLGRGLRPRQLVTGELKIINILQFANTCIYYHNKSSVQLNISF